MKNKFGSFPRRPVVRTLSALSASIVAAFMLSGCGDDSSSTSSNGTQEVSFVKTLDDLEKCDQNLDGDTVFVKEKKADYICEDGEWVLLDDSDDDNTESSSSTETSSNDKKTSSNSKETSSSDKETSSSSKTTSSNSKENSSSSKDVSSSSKKGESAKDSNVVSIKKKTISGISQKGPFVKGSSVTVQELESGTLDQTGKSFKGKISNDKGEFSISSVSLASQFALLEANGFYLNEVSGNKSSTQITLNALVDLSDREKVNINLLTHLEYERALYLTSKGNSVSDAKKQASKEVLKAFGITGDFANSEDLDILSSGDGNAALLAMSILMQGNLKESELSERLANFANDIEEDGTWDDAKTAAKMADWASEQDLSVIRKHIEDWKMGDVPKFEKYVQEFWYGVYGLDACKSENDGEIVKITNKKSARYETDDRLICKNGAWGIATDIEKDTYGWKAGNDGEIKDGEITSTKYKYDEDLKKWSEADEKDAELGYDGCTTKREGEVKTTNGNYICRNLAWKKATQQDVDTYGKECSASNIGDKIELENASYYCYEKGWVVFSSWNWNAPLVTRLNPDYQYGKMTDSRDNQTYKTTQIGSQVWMAQNLNYSDETITPSLKDNNWCYGDNESNCAVGGRLYSWSAAQDACPEDWHLPTAEEYDELFATVKKNEKVNDGNWPYVFKAKIRFNWNTRYQAEYADMFGFSALPTGERSPDGWTVNGNFMKGPYGGEGAGMSSWTATEVDDENAKALGVDYDVFLFDVPKKNGLSIRCIKNAVN